MRKQKMLYITNVYEKGKFNEDSDMRSFKIGDLGNKKNTLKDKIELPDNIIKEYYWFQLNSILNERDVINIDI